MTLRQKIGIRYYRTKINALALVSPSKAIKAAYKLYATPYSGKPKRKAPEIFSKAAKLHFDLEGVTINGFCWENNHPAGKKVLICHGFDSCSYKFEQYVTGFLEAGMDVYAFDAPGHGVSGGKQIHSMQYRDAIVKINGLYGPFQGIMGHSLGAMTTAFAAESIQNPGIKLVLIAPATELKPTIDSFFRATGINMSLYNGFLHLAESIRQLPIEWYSVARSIEHFHNPTLWLHDEDDRVCPFKDVIAVQQKNLEHVHFVTTKGLGHNKIYRDKEIEKVIIDYLAK